MKKKFKVFLVVGCLIILAIVLIPRIYGAKEKEKGKNRIHSFIQSLNTNKNEIIYLKDTELRFYLNTGFTVTETFTTTKDFENWQSIVKHDKKYLNGEKIDDLENLNDISQCEILYEVTYENKKCRIQPIWGPDGKNPLSSEFIQENFSLVIPKKALEHSGYT